ncbi:MAG: helix-turn-helix domain-containing protein [Eubacterium sp.]|nr:helix-turn-helix domain-containing protein [Eubacterium sp.]
MSEKDRKKGKAEVDRNSLRYRTARQLYAQRLMCQMSQKDLAEQVGTQVPNISRMESGRQNITVDYVEALASAMGREVELVLRDVHPGYGDSEIYCLRLYDEELVRFRMVREEYKLEISVLEVNEEKRDLFPLDLEVSPEGIIEWLRNRVVPSNREFVGKILVALGLEINDLKGIIDVCFGLSLNDSYWVVPVGFDGSFGQYNLYENRFSKALSLIAYAGYGKAHRNFQTTPELTTGGMLRKAWRYKEKESIWLYKSGTEGFANAGNEPYCEYYAAQIAERMGLHAVPYELENWHGILASKCRLFTDIDTAYIPIGRIVRTGGIDAVIDFYKELGEDCYQELASMLVFDAVIINEDRHYGNFGLLRDNHTGKFIGPAPIFDNGLSLLCYAMKIDFENGIEDYVETRTNPYGGDRQFMDLCRMVMGPGQKAQLRRLIGFRFRESDLCNLPSWRMQAIEEIIQERVRMLLAM